VNCPESKIHLGGSQRAVIQWGKKREEGNQPPAEIPKRPSFLKDPQETSRKKKVATKGRILSSAETAGRFRGKKGGPRRAG